MLYSQFSGSEFPVDLCLCFSLAVWFHYLFYPFRPTSERASSNQYKRSSQSKKEDPQHIFSKEGSVVTDTHTHTHTNLLCVLRLIVGCFNSLT